MALDSTMNQTQAGANDKKFGAIRGRKPTPRDGHTAGFSQGFMFVFGGDRHHMTFNDLFIIQLE